MSSSLSLAAGRSAFGGDPDGYASARPGYPAAIYDRLLALGALPAAEAFEIGPGTGLGTQKLLSLGAARLAAIEPDSRLAAYLERTLGRQFHQLEILNQGFEDVILPLASFDLGIAATSFHWVEQDAGLKKAISLLRPRGWWAMWWNIYTDPDNPDEFQKAARPLYKQLQTTPAWPHSSRPFGLDADVRLSQMQAAGFVGTGFDPTHWTVTMDTARVLALAATYSVVALAEPDKRTRFLEALGNLVEQSFGGSVERRFVTSLYFGQKPE